MIFTTVNPQKSCNNGQKKKTSHTIVHAKSIRDLYIILCSNNEANAVILSTLFLFFLVSVSVSFLIHFIYL